jgi:hypothetical protein
MISRIKTMKASTPPPEPYFHALSVVVKVSSAMTREKMANCKRMLSVCENIFAISQKSCVVGLLILLLLKKESVR